MEVDVAVGEPLRDVNGVAGLDQLMQAPARNLVTVALIVCCDLGHLGGFDFACFVLT